ncbi:MAG: tyrosine-type recombinase/integrase [Solirubrobacteraceae bacterium]
MTTTSCSPTPETGKPIDRSKLLKRFKAALGRTDVRAVRFRDLRHAFGTRMAAQGMPMCVLQDVERRSHP